MSSLNDLANFTSSISHSKVSNYVIPGLSSSLIGNPSESGVVRLFECSRNHQENITAHSHRFDFKCLVLKGSVRNVIWTESTEGDEYAVSSLLYKGEIGSYSKVISRVAKFKPVCTDYNQGDIYSMKYHQIHSIMFTKGTSVLFFEGEPKSESSVILEPYVNGKIIPTMKVEPWMFQKEKQ